MADRGDDPKRSDLARLATTLRERRPRLSERRLGEIKRAVVARRRAEDEPSPSDLSRLADVLREERPRLSERRLDEIKRDVLAREGRPRPLRRSGSLRRLVVAALVGVGLIGLGTSTIAASVLDWASGASFGSKLLGYEDDPDGVQFFFGGIGFGGDE